MMRLVLQKPHSHLPGLTARLAIATISSILLLTLAACDFSGLFAKAETATGSLSLSFDLGVRGTFYPWNPLSPSLPITTYTVQGTGPYGGATFSREVAAPATGIIVNDLVVGTWSIAVTAKDASDDAIAYGTTEIGVAKDATNSGAVILAPVESGAGRLTVAVSWPLSEFTYPDVAGTITPDGGTATPISFTAGESSASADLGSVAAGSYTISITITYGGVERAAAIAAAQVYANLPTPVVIDLLDADIISSPAAPTWYAASESASHEAVTATAIRFRWSDNSLYDNGYEAEVDSDGVFFIPATTTEYLANGLAPLPAHTFRLRAKNKAGYSDWLTVSGAYTLRSAAEVGWTLDVPSSHTVAFSGQQAEIPAGTNMAVTATPDAAATWFEWRVDGLVWVEGAGKNFCLAGANLESGYHSLSCAATIGGKSYSEEFRFRVAAAPEAVIAGQHHTMLVKNDGSLWSAGDNSYGQFGIDPLVMDQSMTAIRVIPPAAPVSRIADASHQSLVVRRDGRLLVAGRNDQGQLGLGDYDNRDAWIVHPDFNPDTGKAVVGVSAFYGNSYVLTADGTVWSAGANSEGQLGTDSAEPNWPQFAAVPLPYPAIAIAAGYQFAVVLTSEGTLYGFGDDTYGQLGIDPAGGTRYQTPQAVPGVSGAKAVACGMSFTLALLTDTTVVAFGDNTDGNLGANSFGGIRAAAGPVLDVSGAASLVNVVQIAVGTVHAVARLADGTAVAWGNNGLGVLGDGTTDSRSLPVAVLNLTGLHSVSAGDEASFAVTAAGVVWGFGDNYQYQLGDEAVLFSLIPIPCMTGPWGTIDSFYYDAADPTPTITWDALPNAIQYMARFNGGTWMESAVASFTSPNVLPNSDFLFELKQGDGAGGWSQVQRETLTISYPLSTYVAGGTYIMGQTSVAEPAHVVTVSPFFISDVEVTQQLFNSIMSGYTPSGHIGVESELPVEQVTWYDAVEFCNLFSIQLGLNPVYIITDRVPGSGYPITSATVTANFAMNGSRLPTEAEWEFAARGGASSNNYNFSGSNNYNLVAWNMENSSGVSHGVGWVTVQANELGIHDMTGNLSEWCWDYYDTYGADPATDPTGPVSGTDRIFRGSNFTHDLSVWGGLRETSSRNWDSASYSDATIGFRLAASVAP